MPLPTSGLITINDRGARTATTFGSVEASGGNMVFIKKLTASSSANLSFVDGTSSVVLDSTYKEYVFTINNIHPQTNDESFTVNFRDGGTDYDAVKTTASFRAYHDEAGTTQAAAYVDNDLAQSTAVQPISNNLGSDADQCVSGYLHLFNPSSTTFVKHFQIHTNTTHASDYTNEWHFAGYCNTTSAIDGVQFKMSSGNIDSGDICLYGIL